MAYEGITVPTNFKSKGSRLNAQLLNKQLGFVQGAELGLDPFTMAEGFKRDALRGLEGDSTGYLLAEQTGDPGAQAAYDLAQKNKATEQYNDLLAFFSSPEGRLQIARAKAGLYGPETLSMLSVLQQRQPGQGGGLFGDLLKVGATGASMGWSPFG